MLPAGEVFFTALWLLLSAKAAGQGVPLQVVPLGPTEAASHMPSIHLPSCMTSQVVIEIDTAFAGGCSGDAGGCRGMQRDAGGRNRTINIVIIAGVMNNLQLKHAKYHMKPYVLRQMVMLTAHWLHHTGVCRSREVE